MNLLLNILERHENIRKKKYIKDSYTKDIVFNKTENSTNI
jgi:hypothetical protein